MVVWVVVASKYGSTREVAEAIAEEFGHGHEVQVRDAAELESFQGRTRSCSAARSTAGTGSSRPAS